MYFIYEYDSCALVQCSIVIMLLTNDGTPSRDIFTVTVRRTFKTDD